MADEKHIIIRLIQLGVSKGVKGVSPQEYDKWKQKNNIAHKDEVHLCNELLHQCFDTVRQSGQSVFLLKVEHYFNHVDHLELVEARQAAKEARFFAFIAIALSIMAIAVEADYNPITTIVNFFSDMLGK